MGKSYGIRLSGMDGESGLKMEKILAVLISLLSNANSYFAA